MANPFAMARRPRMPPATKADLIQILERTSLDPVWQKWNTTRAIKEGFKSSSWVYAAINRLMKSVASVPWQTLTGIDGDDPEVQRDAAATALLRRPNPLMGGNQFFRLITSHLYLGGNAIIKKQKTTRRARNADRNPVLALWPINPARVTVEEGEGVGNLIYKVEVKHGADIEIPQEDIIHILFVDPENPLWGMSPLQAVARVVDTDVESVKWNMMALQNRSVPDGIFSFDQPLTTDQWEEAKQHVKEEHSGAENSRRPWVIGAGAKWQQMSLSPAEMDFLESRKLSREEILSVFEVPPPLVGIYENATLANIETARKIFWIDTVVPLLDVFADVFTNQLGPDFGIDGMSSKLTYDVSNVDAFQDSLENRVEAATKMWKLGVTMEALNKHFELGLEPFDGWDVSWVPTNVIPAIDVIEGGTGNDNLEGVDLGNDGDNDVVDDDGNRAEELDEE